MRIFLALCLSFCITLGADEYNTKLQLTEKATTIYIKKNHLKGDFDKKLKSLQRQIARLSEREKLSKKMQQKLHQLECSVAKITFWKRYYLETQKSHHALQLYMRIKSTKKNTGRQLKEAEKKYAQASHTRGKMRRVYSEMCGEQFPVSFHMDILKIYKKLSRKQTTIASKTSKKKTRAY